MERIEKNNQRGWERKKYWHNDKCCYNCRIADSTVLPFTVCYKRWLGEQKKKIKVTDRKL